MNHLAAAVLLHLGGKPVDEKGIKDVIVAAGGKADDAQIKKIVEKLKGKDVLKFAKENLGKVSTGGSSAPVEVKKEEKKEEKKDDKKGADAKKGAEKKKPEPEPEEDDMPMGLF
jgi:ribosomal protein L12E/L44/L45/RPP1/RPP2